MSDNTIRDRLAEILRDHIDFWSDDVADAPEAILREFLVVPRSEIVGKDFFVLPVTPPSEVPDGS